MQIPLKEFKQKVWRIIPSRFPPIDLFERIAAPQDWDILIELESMTNPRIRDEVGDISLVPVEDRVCGQGAGYIMAAFTHLNPLGSRFSDGSFGVFYASDTIECAVAETTYHKARFLSYTNEPAQSFEMRVLVAEINALLHDLATIKNDIAEVYSLDNYYASQELGKELKAANANGIYYLSVRNFSGNCVAAFKPKIISKCKQERHLEYRWDGQKIAHVLEIRSVNI